MGEDFIYFNESTNESTKGTDIDYKLTRKIYSGNVLNYIKTVCNIMNWNDSTDIIKAEGDMGSLWYYISGHLHCEEGEHIMRVDEYCEKCPLCNSDTSLWCVGRYKDTVFSFQ